MLFDYTERKMSKEERRRERWAILWAWLFSIAASLVITYSLVKDSLWWKQL